LQEGILFHHMMSTDVDPYITPSLLSVDSEEAFNEITQGMQFIIDRHDIMRTAVMWKDTSQALQVVCREVDLSITWLDSELDSDQDIGSQMQARSEAVQPLINLEEAPLFRLQVAFEEETGRYFVLIQIHHIIADHVVFEIIQRELEAYKAGQAASLPASVPYRDAV